MRVLNTELADITRVYVGGQHYNIVKSDTLASDGAYVLVVSNPDRPTIRFRVASIDAVETNG